MWLKNKTRVRGVMASLKRFKTRAGFSTGSGEALGDDLPVAAVRAEDEVLDAQGHALAHHGGLLPDGQVRGPEVIVGDPLVGALGLDRVEHGLELADHDHVAVGAHERVLAVLLDFLLHVGDVGVERDVA